MLDARSLPPLSAVSELLVFFHISVFVRVLHCAFHHLCISPKATVGQVSDCSVPCQVVCPAQVLLVSVLGFIFTVYAITMMELYKVLNFFDLAVLVQCVGT